MGSGKSTAARAVGTRAGLPVVDLDQAVEQRAGATIAELFAARGEAAFRALERETMRALIADNARGVFALGGGTVIDRALRRELLGAGVLVTLQAPAAELAARVGAGQGRPLLAGEQALAGEGPAARLAALLLARADAYAECHGAIDTAGRDPDGVAAAVLELAADPRVVVPLGTRTYRVEIGAGVRARLPERTAAMAASPRIALISNDVVGPIWGEPLAAALRAAGKDVTSVVLPDGEAHKTARSVERVWEAALSAGLDRGSGFVSVGGGVIGDLAGFAAATLLRGVPVGHVPTTLLAMVDSAIGGKTGFDTAHGKNLIGAFHQPSFVLCDTDVLSTLPDAERRAGLAEVVKSAWIDGEAAVAELERDREALRAGEPTATARAIRMSAALKARIVTEDERESGARALLNLGHTVGHAIEAAEGYRGLRHGEAVALGMVAAFELAARIGHLDGADVERLRALLAALGLPTAVHPYLEPRVLSFIGADKKRRAGQISFVLPGRPGDVRLAPFALDRLTQLLATR
jgi:shikimate kinase/3-dehydroquinate synthase